MPDIVILTMGQGDRDTDRQGRDRLPNGEYSTMGTNQTKILFQRKIKKQTQTHTHP